MDFVPLMSTYKTRVVVCRARSLHASKSDAFDAGKDAVFADKPVSVFGFRILSLLLDHDAEYIRDVLVQCARLAIVVECSRVLSNSMG